MANFKGSIDLMQLRKVGMVTIKGIKCAVVPILENDLVVYDRSKDNKPSSLYLNVVVWENKNGANEYGNTHGIKQDFTKEYREMREEDVKNSPFLGNLAPLTGHTQADAVEAIKTDNDMKEDDIDNKDDLPF